MSVGNLGLVLSCVVLSCVLARYVRGRRSLSLPPGPPSIPLFGNLHHFSLNYAWLRLMEMKERYGPLVMFHGLGNYILVVNTESGIRDLLEKRYAIYSDRPRMVMLGELAGASRHMSLVEYGEPWREQRKFARIALGADAVLGYHSIIDEVSIKLCKDIIRSSADIVAHLKLATGRIIVPIMYGIEVESAENEYIIDAERTGDFASANLAPGSNLCDLFPALVHLPSWLPFHRRGRLGRELVDKMTYKPYNHVKQQMAAGTAPPSVTQRLLEQYQDQMSDELEHAIQCSAASMYSAGSETMYGTILVFILAMALHPDKQRKAQAEIDALVGPYGLPTLSNDLERLPYINAVIKETVRWHPIVPIGVPRRLKEDDVYQGYRIPKGTAVMPNIWALSREPNSKYSPDEFIPERFLDPTQDVVDPLTWIFGFGRRVCPGRALAEKTLLSIICHILVMFDIEEIPDKPITPEFVAFGTTSYPLPFECAFKPRRTFD